jgi:aspartyl-tRNA(Asn)/glutamyl-tRNA(Gln) amidotransferase subunit C
MASPHLDIKDVAHLARLRLTPEEQSHLGGQLDHILGFIAKLSEVNVEGVEPTAHAFPLVNVTRPDQVRSSLPHDEAMKNAPARTNGLFQVPKIVE